MLEIERLEEMLRKEGIPYLRRSQDLRPQMHNWFKHQIIYPNSYAVPGRVCSVIQGTCTYGGLENKLEIMGLLTAEEKENDDVCGWLTAEDVFARIKAHWEKVK